MKRLAWILALVCIVAALMVQRQPIIAERGSLDPEMLNVGRDVLSRIQNQTVPGLFLLELKYAELHALGAVLSDLEPQRSYAFTFKANGLDVKLQQQFSVASLTFYLNAHCTLANQQSGVDIAKCKLGMLPLPAWIARLLVDTGVSVLGSEEQQAMLESVMAGTSIIGQQITVVAKTPVQFFANNTAGANADNLLAEAWLATQATKAKHVETYVKYLQSLKFDNYSLSNWLFSAMHLASLSPNNASVEDENEAAIWALAILFGSDEFAKIIGGSTRFNYISVVPASLGGRRDLAQHFLYSAILYLLGNSELALSVGKMKEQSDSMGGGSGYSFVDLAADKAGLLFAKQLTKSRRGALAAQCILNGKPDERYFFPAIDSLPEGIGNKQFKALYGNQNSAEYVMIESLIDSRLNALPLFQESYALLCGGNSQ